MYVESWGGGGSYLCQHTARSSGDVGAHGTAEREPPDPTDEKIILKKKSAVTTHIYGKIWDLLCSTKEST